MLNEILSEFQKVREKDKITKRGVSDMINNLKSELTSLSNGLDNINDEMTVNK